MKKLFAFLALFGLFFYTHCSFAYQIKADAQTRRLSAGTKLNLVMAEPVTTEDVEEGDMFQARLVNNIRIANRTVLPSGTLVRGTVKKVGKTGLFSKSAVLYLSFDHVVTPQGRQLPLRAAVCSGFDINPDGALSGGGNYFNELKRNAKKAGYIISRTTKWGVSAGDDLFTGGRFLLTPIAAVGGTLGGGVYLVGDSVIDLFRHGNDVVINQGQAFDAILLQPLDVPLS